MATIDLQLHRKIHIIWLNQKELKLEQVDVRAEGGVYLPVRWETPDEFVRVKLHVEIRPRKADLRIAYDGKLNDKSSVGADRKEAGNDGYVYMSFTPIDRAERSGRVVLEAIDRIPARALARGLAATCLPARRAGLRGHAAGWDRS